MHEHHPHTPGQIPFINQTPKTSQTPYIQTPNVHGNGDDELFDQTMDEVGQTRIYPSRY